MAASDHLGMQFKQPGLPGGGDPGENYDNVGWMEIHHALRHREYDDRTPGWKDKNGPGSYDRLKDDIARNGIKTPVGIYYDDTTHQAVVGEGNHRIQAAYELGHQAVPVTVHPGRWLSSHFETMRGNPAVATPQILHEKVSYKTKPSDVFGDEYRADPRAMKIGREIHLRDDQG